MSTSVLRTSVDIAPQFLRMLEGIFPYLPQKRDVISQCLGPKSMLSKRDSSYLKLRENYFNGKILEKDSTEKYV